MASSKHGRCATTGEQVGSPALSILRNQKKFPNLGKKPWLCLSLDGLNFPFKMWFQQYVGEKTPKFFPAEPFFRVFLTKWLSKCLHSIKPPLPWKISGCAPALGNNTQKVRVPNEREMWLPCFDLSRSYLLMRWRFHVIPRVHCCHFCLEPTVRRDAWLRTTSVTVMVILFERNILKVTWSQLCSKFLLKIYKEHWQQHFERYPTVK